MPVGAPATSEVELPAVFALAAMPSAEPCRDVQRNCGTPKRPSMWTAEPGRTRSTVGVAGVRAVSEVETDGAADEPAITSYSGSLRADAAVAVPALAASARAITDREVTWFLGCRECERAKPYKTGGSNDKNDLLMNAAPDMRMPATTVAGLPTPLRSACGTTGWRAPGRLASWLTWNQAGFSGCRA